MCLGAFVAILSGLSGLGYNIDPFSIDTESFLWKTHLRESKKSSFLSFYLLRIIMKHKDWVAIVKGWKDVFKAYGQIAILVNIAGIDRKKANTELVESTWDFLFEFSRPDDTEFVAGGNLIVSGGR